MGARPDMWHLRRHMRMLCSRISKELHVGWRWNGFFLYDFIRIMLWNGWPQEDRMRLTDWLAASSLLHYLISHLVTRMRCQLVRGWCRSVWVWYRRFLCYATTRRLSRSEERLFAKPNICLWRWGKTSLDGEIAIIMQEAWLSWRIEGDAAYLWKDRQRARRTDCVRRKTCSKER